MLAAIDAAKKSVCLEIYTYTDSSLGRRFREALIRTQARGVRVRVHHRCGWFDVIAGQFLGAAAERRRRSAPVQSDGIETILDSQSSQVARVR